ncbi:unnamed protein product [Orchesella dallaii]|uniref:Uncharacterized protein n=1 Tax=Orchesella dallaii TaxID=48710 RepID=A0ABP1QUF6_9HEXA
MERQTTAPEDVEHDSNTTQGIKKSKYRYTDENDIAILREVLLEQPCGKLQAEKWKKIFGNLNIPVLDGKALRRRFDYLMSCFIKKSNKSLRGSGLEEDYTEKMKLLQDISDQKEQWNLCTEETDKKRKLVDEQRKAQEIRDASMRTFENAETVTDEESPTTETPVIKRKRMSRNEDVLKVLQQSEERENSTKTLVLDLEKSRLELMKRDLDMKEANDVHRREMDARRVEMEEFRLKTERERSERESEDRKMLLALIQKLVKK